MQKSLKEELIRKRESFGAEDEKKPSAAKLLKVITRENERVKRGVSSLEKNDATWLFDNFYLLEQACLSLMKNKGTEYSRLIAFTDIYAEIQNGADTDSLSSLFEVLCYHDFLSEKEIENIRVSLIYSCLFKIVERIGKKSGVGEKIKLLSDVWKYDFTALVSGFSPSERYLRCDPAGVWQKMSRASRESYKKHIYRMAKKEGVGFSEMCKNILEKASAEGRHIGEYIDFKKSSPVVFYVALAVLFPALLCVSFFVIFTPSMPFLSALCVALVAVPLFETSYRLCAFLVSLFKKSEALVSVELEKIDAENATLVTIPCLIGSQKDLDELFSHLERLFLKSRTLPDDEVVFSLLADFPEADRKRTKTDGQLLFAARERVERLNEKYPDHFAFFSRERVFDKTSGKYVAHERKRGALLELAKFALQKPSKISSIGAKRRKFKYIVTLDSDTEMGLSDLYKMIGTASHPLNRPVVSHDGGVARVVKGFGIFQPAIIPSLVAAYSTPFSLLISGAGGFDNYHGPAFDLHHVLHGRGMFCGKGIFDVEVFLEVLEDAFPDGIILSHDMLEGSRLRTGFLADMEFSDGVPKNIISYYKRSHRWARGDVQALLFTTPTVVGKHGEKVKNPQPVSDRFVFFVNFLNLLSPIFSVLSIFVSMTKTDFSGEVVFFALSPLWLYSSIQLVMALVHFSFAGFYRRFFTQALTGIRREVLHLFFSLCALLYRAWKNFDAIVRSLWRCAVSGKNLLEWTTALDAENAAAFKKGSLPMYFVETFPSTLFGIAFLILSTDAWARLLGILWCSFFFVGYLTSKNRKRIIPLTPAEKETLISYAEKTWRFFENCALSEDNFLPCDNISINPHFSKAHRTSPTNIGLYLISCLAACDFGFIDTKNLVSRLENTLETLEKLPKYKGQLYNWYDTVNCTVLGQEYVSSVDSGNFVACLVALVEGLYEYRADNEKIDGLIERFRALEENADFKFLYDNKRKLFSLGFNVEKNERESGCYDLYMSEMRTTDYYAVSRGIVPKEHWQSLSRPLITRGSMLGAASWSGTAFEYFMPHLFLPVFENSFVDEALSFAFAEQAQFSQMGVFGISESGYFAFDRDMNYQYRAFGVPALSLRREREKEKVFSPYSTFLMLSKNVSLCLKNLARFEKLGMLGDWGFYEAIDFNPVRVGGGHAMVKSYMAHHVGMSFVAMANILFDNVFVRRFIGRGDMGSAVELLQEKIPTDAVVLKKSVTRENETKLPTRFSVPDSQTLCRDGERAASALLVGREMNMTVCDRGVVSAFSENASLIRPRRDGEFMSFLPWGMSDGQILSPCHNRKNRFLYGKGYCRYQNEIGTVFINLSSSAPAVRVKVSLKKERGQALFEKGIYIEPCLVLKNSYFSHPAYCQLFFESFYDGEKKALFLEYKGQKGRAMCVMSNGDFEFETSREKIFRGKEAGVRELFEYIEKTPRMNSNITTPLSPCVLAKSLDKTKSDAVFVIGYGNTRAEAHRAATLELEKTQHKSFSDSDEYAVRLLRTAGILEEDTTLTELILNSLAASRKVKKSETTPLSYGREKLWEMGVSGDFPIVCVFGALPEKTIEKILRVHKFHYISGLLYDLVLVCSDSGYEQKERDGIMRLIDSTQTRFMENVQGGVFVVGEDKKEMFCTAACLVIECESDIVKVPGEKPFERCKTSPPKKPVKPWGFQKGAYVIDRGGYNPKILWHHIIAADSFGTVVSNRSLGHTYVYNAALSKLTVWENDRVGGGESEKLFLTVSGKKRDLCKDANRVVYSAGLAVYEGDGYEIRVSIHPKLLIKQVRVKFKFDAEIKLEYRAHFVMGDGVAECSSVFSRQEERGMFFRGPFSEHLKKGFGYLVFLGREKVTGTHDSLEVEMSVQNGSEAVFFLGYAGSEKHFEYIFKNPPLPEQVENDSRRFAEQFLKEREESAMGENVGEIYNFWLPLQCSLSRFVARTGPYQSGGAWGARDQAQDALFLMKRTPHRVRSHIFRMCAHQFVSGDVQHWYHGFRGTRTRCSDDYLWLVLLVSQYIKETGDESVLDVEVRYLDSAPLSQNERERYEECRTSEVKESVLNHLIRALDLFISRGLGAHGLPYMGSGDWNDGMDFVGEGGGESVWLGFFALIVFYEAYPLLEKRGVDTKAYREFCDGLYKNIEENAFFTDRYARAFLQDGTPLGVSGDACALDGLVQAFSSICYHVTGYGNKARISAALDSAYRELYDGENKLFRLFSPSFKEPDMRVGYVTLYPQGVRENGGQYTHAAVWSAFSYLLAPAEKKKNRKRALEILECILPTDRDPDRYLTEPYVLSADIYSNPDHTGRGGWSFYTGSAGWCAALIEQIIKTDEKPE